MTAPSTPDLVAQLLAAIDETERIAQAAAKDSEPEWSPGNEHLGEHVHTAEYGSAVVCGPYGYLGWELRQHVALHDPGAVLRRCHADQKTLELHRVEEPEQDRLPGFCAHCGWRFPCPDVRNLAEGYGITEEEGGRE